MHSAHNQGAVIVCTQSNCVHHSYNFAAVHGVRYITVYEPEGPTDQARVHPLQVCGRSTIQQAGIQFGAAQQPHGCRASPLKPQQLKPQQLKPQQLKPQQPRQSARLGWKRKLAEGPVASANTCAAGLGTKPYDVQPEVTGVCCPHRRIEAALQSALNGQHFTASLLVLAGHQQVYTWVGWMNE